MPKQKKVNNVTETSLDKGLAPEELTREGLPVNSPEAKELYKQREFLSITAMPSFQSAADSRRRYDQEWLSRNLFWRGYQFSSYLPTTQTVVLTTRQSARVPINLAASMMRSIRNQVTSFRPKFEILPTNPGSVSAKSQARYAQRLLDYYFDKLGLKMKIKETVTQALLYSVGGPWQIVYDEQKKEVRVWLLDPFDFYVDPLCEDFKDAEYVIKAVRRPISYITRNPEFNLYARNEISGGDSKIAASEYKQFMIQALKNISPRQTDAAAELILYEGSFKRRDDNGNVYIVKVIWTDQNVTPLYYKELDGEDEFDYVMYRGDLNPKDIYGESWFKHVMPINRALNNLESSVFDYNYRVAKGRILIDRDAGVRSIHNVHGEIVSKNRGSEVKAMDMPALPVATQNQIERLWRYMEDVSGVHDVTMGRLPTGIKSGVGIAELRQADASSQDDLVDNLEDFLSDVAFKILKVIANNYSGFKVIKDLGAREGDEKYFVAVGKSFAKKKLNDRGQVKIGPDWLDVAEIGDDNNIRVSVGSWLGYTKEALQQKVLTYFQAGLIDQATALRLLEFGDVDEIVRQARIEQMMKKPANPNNPQEVDQMGLAMTENEMLLEGKDVPVSENDDHMVHIAVHQDALGRGMDELVGQHIAKHQIMMGSGIGAMADASGYDPQDQGRQTAIQGAINEEAPVGPTSGTQLPQQDVNQTLTDTNDLAGQAMSMGQ